MRGKKSDPDFVVNFIEDCCKKGKTSSYEIIDEAKKQIKDIDDKIKEVEYLRKVRSKIHDVIFSFEKEIKNNREKKERLLFILINSF